MKITVEDVNGLREELKRLTNLELEAVTKKSLTQMLNRARQGGTPVDSGELRLSSAISMDEMGYGKEYAAHVEYGHRTRGGGRWVPGQYFLKKNVETQGPIFEEDVLKRIRKI